MRKDEFDALRLKRDEGKMIVPHPHGGQNAVGSGNRARRSSAVRRGGAQPVTAGAGGAQHPSAARRGDRQGTAHNFPPAAPQHLHTARHKLSARQRVSQPSSASRPPTAEATSRAALPSQLPPPRARRRPPTAAPSRSPQPLPPSRSATPGCRLPQRRRRGALAPRGGLPGVCPLRPPPTYLRAAGRGSP